MKKLFILILIIASCLVIAGGVLFGIGLANAKKDLVVSNVNVTDTFNKIDVDLNTCDIEFKLATDLNVSVELKEREKEPHKVEVFDNTLTIKSNDQRPWYEKIFSFSFNSPKITVFLPAGIYGDVKINTSTSDVKFSSGLEFNNINIEISTGDTVINSNLSDSINIKSSTGDITIENSSVLGNIDLSVSTGNITLNNVTAHNFKADSSTGDVTLRNTLFSNNITIETSEGDVTFDNSDGNTINVKTSTGDVEGTLKSNKIFYTETSTGDVNVPHSTEGGLCEIKTSTGNIKIRIS